MKQEFITAVAEKNLAKVRISLSNELLLDPRGTTFSEMLSYAINHIPHLFEENRESDFIVPPEEEWDEEFLFIVKNDLDSNFSREKLAFYESVVKTVGKSKAEEIEQEEKEMEKEMETEREQQRRSQSKPINKTYATVSAGGATLALVGLVAGKTLLTVVGGAVLIVGGVLLLNDRMDKQ